MCGRFTLTVTPDELQDAFPDFHIPVDLPVSYNIAPSQPVAALPNQGQQRLTFFQWGLIPSWTKEEQLGKYAFINARGETASEKASFKAAYKRRRCLIPADGFYEWKKENSGEGKTPYYIQMKNKAPFAFAGLWEIWQSSQGDEIHSCCIITTRPNKLVSEIHKRMPVILAPEEYPRWLIDAEVAPGELDDLLDPYPGDLMEAYPVSTYVNNPRNNSPRCIQAEESQWQPPLEL